MESWVMGTKLVILLYCILRYISGDMSRISYVLLSILVYTCFNMLSSVLRNVIYRRSALIAACAVLAISARIVHPLFILLLPINIVELVGEYTDDFRIWAAVALMPVFFCTYTLRPEYLLSTVLSLMIISLAYRVYAGIKRLKEENDRLRDKNDMLLGKLDVGTEYENQLKYLSQLEERNSVAQKIHDRVGHTIAGSLIQLEAISVILDSDREKAGGMLGNVILHLKEGMEGIRSTLRSIKPAPEQLGINRLKVILDEFSLNHSIKTVLNCKGSMDAVSHAQWKIITDNTKEALTNTLKYASASMVQVNIEVMNKLVRTEVRDNGKGAGLIKKGLGIAGMEERTESAGGKLIVDGSKGFSIVMLLPVGGGGQCQ